MNRDEMLQLVEDAENWTDAADWKDNCGRLGRLLTEVPSLLAQTKLKTQIEARLTSIGNYVDSNTNGNILNIDSQDLLYLQGAEQVLNDVKEFLETTKYPEGEYHPDLEE